MAETIQKLTAETYHEWKFEMKMMLIGKNLWDIVVGTETVHELSTHGEIMKFRRRQNHALSVICLNISRDLHIYVRNAKSAKEAWDNLSDRFEERSITRKLELRRKLYDAKLNHSSMIEHINNIKTIAEQLQSLDDTQTERDLVYILMSSVPMNKYRNLIATLETIDENRLTWEYVRDRMITEYNRIMQCEDEKKAVTPHRVHDALFVAPPNNRSRSNDMEGPREERSCHYCKETGHMIKDCEKRRKAEENKRKKEAERESSAFCEEERIPWELEIALQVGIEGDESNTWYLDSGCSRHMTSEETDFSCLKPIHPIPVALADQSVIYAIGEGTVRTEMMDVKGNVVGIAFENVLYVPHLRKKLVSISEVTKRGAEIIFKTDTCILSCKGRRFKFGSKVGKLYELNLI